jgi:multidrug transporter EmrE-like cation transporter
MVLVVLALTIASAFYVAGGVAMKYSMGYRMLIPTLLVFLFFNLAVIVQNWAMNHSELGKGYVYVLGLEAILAVLAGAFFFDEAFDWTKVLGVVIIIIGMGILKLV